MRTFNNTESDIRDQLKVFWTSKPFTPHAIAAHPNVSQAEINILQQALLEMNDATEAMELLKAINFKGFERAQHSDWDDVRSLKIELLEDLK